MANRQFENLGSEALLRSAPSLLFAIALIVFPMLLLLFGSMGLPGNSAVTGSLLAFLVIGLCGLGCLNQSTFHLSVLDVLFVVFLIPFVVTGFEFRHLIEIKEAGLFVICGIMAYVAGRSTGLEKLAAVPRYTLIVSAAVVALACAATVPELYRVWNVAEKRPIVFDFEHAVNLFAMTLGPLIFGFVYSRKDWKSIQSSAVGVLIYFATALFVASLVRYTFAALMVSIGFMLVISISTKDRVRTCRLALAVLAVVLGIVSGVIARYASVYSFATAVLQEPDDSSSRSREVVVTKIPEMVLVPGTIGSRKFVKPVGDNAFAQQPLPPSCRIDVGTFNSVLIRRGLYQDSIYFVPRSGLFGIGLDNFKKLTCTRGHQVHNIYLQALIEAGWLGGAALIALAVCPLYFLPGLIRSMEPSELLTFMFLIVSFGFAALLGLVHGTISRELSFFLCVGAISGAIFRRRQSDGTKAL